jgi:hypothetical protein
MNAEWRFRRGYLYIFAFIRGDLPPVVAIFESHYTNRIVGIEDIGKGARWNIICRTLQPVDSDEASLDYLWISHISHLPMASFSSGMETLNQSWSAPAYGHPIQTMSS